MFQNFQPIPFSADDEWISVNATKVEIRWIRFNRIRYYLYKEGGKIYIILHGTDPIVDTYKNITIEGDYSQVELLHAELLTALNPFITSNQARRASKEVRAVL